MPDENKAIRKIRLGHRKRRAIFGLDAIALIGVAIAIIMVMAAVAQVFATQLEGAYVDLTTLMPTFGNATSSVAHTTNSTTTTTPGSLTILTNLGLFNLMRNAAIMGLSFVMMYAGMSLMFENIQLMAPGTAYQIMSKGIFIVLFLFIFPTLWDAWAGAVEYGSRWLLDPTNSGQSQSLQLVFGYISGDKAFFGGTGVNGNFDIMQLINNILDPGKAASYISNQLQAVFLSVIGAVITLIITILTFMFATMRQVLTAVLIIALPLILVINLVPIFQPITRRLMDALIGLSIVPIFSSLVLTAGAVYLNTLPTGELQGWFAAVSVLALSAFMPTLLVPMIGSLFQSVTGLVSSGVMAGAMLTGNAALGGARGLTSALGGAGAAASASGGTLSKFDMAKTAMAGLGQGFGGGAMTGLSSAGAEVLGHFGLGKEARKILHHGGANVGQSIVDGAGATGAKINSAAMGEVTGANVRAMLLDSAALGSPIDPQARADALDSFNKNYAPMMKMSPVDITSKLGFDVADKEKFGTEIKNVISDISKNDDMKAGLAHNTQLYGGLTPVGMKSFVDSKGGMANVMGQVDGNQRIIENKIGSSLSGSIHTPLEKHFGNATTKIPISPENLHNIGARLYLNNHMAYTSPTQPNLLSEQLAHDAFTDVSNNVVSSDHLKAIVDMYVQKTVGSQVYLPDAVGNELTSQMADIIKSNGPDITAQIIQRLRNQGDLSKLKLDPAQLYSQFGAKADYMSNALRPYISSGLDFHKILTSGKIVT